jgi:DNA-binding NtrC family response regulator
MRVLIADDDAEQRTFLSRLISSWGHRVEMAADGAEALERAPVFAPNVIVTDLMMPGVGGLELMRRLRVESALPPTIVLTAFGSIELAIETVHSHGGFWFLEKPVDPGTFRALLERAADHGRIAAENERLRKELSHRGVLGELVGQSPAMRNVFSLIQQVAPTNACVLITGESGSGKELVARAIHSFSSRNVDPFLAINCAAMPETLMESELFGHEKGAFTGAAERQIGALELAKGGTLFLDEIGEMPLPMQAKLLRVLEDFQFRRLGGKEALTADVRLISAMNRAPAEAIQDKKLREDLYYRLNVFAIELPPLRDRLEDIPLITAALIEKLNQKHGTRITHIDPDACIALQSHHWIGNVRELRNIIERAMILAGEGPVLKSHLFMPSPPPSSFSPADANDLDGQVGMTIAHAERILIESTLRRWKNNKTQAAAALGISAKTLHAKLQQYRASDAEGQTAHEAERAKA